MFKVSFIIKGEAEPILLFKELSTGTIALIKSVSESSEKYWDSQSFFDPSHTSIDIDELREDYEDLLTDSYGQKLELSTQADLLRELTYWINLIAFRADVGAAPLSTLDMELILFLLNSSKNKIKKA